MAFPRTSEGLLDIEAYVNLLTKDPAAAQLMYDELDNEDEETINYFFDNIERVTQEVIRKNNEKLTQLNARSQELDAQKRVYVAAYEKSMQGTLDELKTKDGRSLTESEKQALNRQLAQEEANLFQQASMPQKTEEQLRQEEKAKRKKLLADFDRKLEAYMEAEAAKNPQPSTHQQTTTNHNKTSKNRGCTIF